MLTAHNANLPFVVTKCVAEVEARGLTSEGIYRLSGFAEEIEAIKMAFDKGAHKFRTVDILMVICLFETDGEKANLAQDRYPNINVIAGALKLYLRLLPIPLITFLVYPLLMDALSKYSFTCLLNLICPK